jgi:addiction module HigA family antidote
MRPDTALRVATVFGSSAEFWMTLQANWDLWHTREKMGKDLKNLRRIKRAA